MENPSALRANGVRAYAWAVDPRLPALFVWGVWALMLLSCLYFVCRFGWNIPAFDEWFMLPVLLGKQPVTLQWLWEPYYEHRLPLNRLTLLAIIRSTADFRVGECLSTLALGLLAAALVRAAQRLRGRLRYTDAFLPLVLLHWGHSEVLLLTQMLAFSMTGILAGVVLLAILLGRAQRSLTHALLAGVCLLLLPTNGIQGAVLVPPLAIWLGYWWSDPWNSANPAQRRYGLLVLLLAVLSLLILPLYFYDLPPPDDVPSQNPSICTALRGAVQVLSMGFGPATADLWPTSGWIAVGIFIVGVLRSVASWRSHPEERYRASGLLALLLALGLLALATGYGRAGLGPDYCFLSHYALLPALALCTIYFIDEIYRPTSKPGLVPLGLLALACVLFHFNQVRGFGYGEWFGSVMAPFEKDLLAGMPPELLVECHGNKLNPTFSGLPSATHIEQVATGLHLLRQASFGVFRNLKDLVYEKQSIPIRPTELREMSWEWDTAYGRGSNPVLGFSLAGPQQVYAIRLTYSMNYGNSEPEPVSSRVSWRRIGQHDYPENGQVTTVELNSGRGDQTATVWVNDRIDQFRIQPDVKPCVFRIVKIILWVPSRGRR